MPSRRHRKFIDGVPIDADRRECVLRRVDEFIATRSYGHHIAITNTESMYHARRLSRHAEYIESAEFSLCDGVGVILAGRAWGVKIRRYNGPVFQLDCSRYGTERGWRHYYVGGTNGSADEMRKRLQSIYPGMLVCGTYEPPFRPLTTEEWTGLINDICESKPDIVWVGLGLVKQERFIASLKREVNVPWMVGVGGAFDYHSGRVPWAPAALRYIGAEWLFRLIVQPRLRARRYWWSAVWMFGASFRGLAARLMRFRRVTQ